MFQKVIIKDTRFQSFNFRFNWHISNCSFSLQPFFFGFVLFYLTFPPRKQKLLISVKNTYFQLISMTPNLLPSSPFFFFFFFFFIFIPSRTNSIQRPLIQLFAIWLPLNIDCLFTTLSSVPPRGRDICRCAAALVNGHNKCHFTKEVSYEQL